MTSVGAGYTADFIYASLPPGAKRVLEIGCGNGEVSALLVERGLSVVAIDSDPDAVAAARARAVDARHSRWPDFPETGFDAVLFTRSLHHVAGLGESVDAAFERLAEGGRVIVEDFAYDEAPEPTLRWFRGLARIVARCGALPAESAAAGLIGTPEPLQAWWRGEHDHDLHGPAAIDAALRASATHVRSGNAAYYFRYLGGRTGEEPPMLDAILAHEIELGEQGVIQPLGRRWVAGREPL